MNYFTTKTVVFRRKALKKGSVVSLSPKDFTEDAEVKRIARYLRPVPRKPKKVVVPPKEEAPPKKVEPPKEKAPPKKVEPPKKEATPKKTTRRKRRTKAQIAADKTAAEANK